MQIAGSPFRTRSLYAAAFLLASDFPLLETARDSAGRVEFIIGGAADELRTRIHEYRAGTALVNAQRFGGELRRLKSLVHGTD